MQDPDYTPDSWKIVEITEKATGAKHKRVLCSWYGGYLGGDCWKLSSGNMEVEDCGDYWTIPQHSGSVYQLYKNREHVSSMMGSIYKKLNTDGKLISMEWSSV